MDKHFIFDEMNFFAPDGKPVPAPVLPEIPEDKLTTFEVIDNRAGRSAVAIAMNHGNSNFEFARVREIAHLVGLVDAQTISRASSSPTAPPVALSASCSRPATAVPPTT